MNLLERFLLPAICILIFCSAPSIPAVIGGVPVRVDTSYSVPVGGIDQWINIKAADPSAPVLLFLHGGPGNSAMSYADKFTGQLQNYFVVVQWDQRESGQTAVLNATDKPLTVELMESDALELIRYLANRFKKQKIYLMGHSWGGFLGLLIASHHPELLEGYIAICPMIDQTESEKASLKWMIGQAKLSNNQQALSDLEKVHIPFRSGEELYYHRGWLQHFIGRKFPEKEFVETWAVKWLPLFNEASKLNFFQSAPSLSCPVYFFAGGRDYQTYYKITEDYYNVVAAKKKKFFLFKDSAHNLTTSEPERLRQTIIAEVLGKK